MFQRHSHIFTGPLRAAEGDAASGGPSAASATSATAPASTDAPSTSAPAGEKTFTQKQLDEIVQGRLRKVSDELSRARAELATTAEKVKAAEALQQRLEQLEAQFADAGKPEHEQKIAQTTRELARAQALLRERDSAIEAARLEATKHQAALADYVVKDQIGQALARAKVLTPAMEHAIAAFRAETNARLEDGKVVATFGGLDFAGNIDDAATRWLTAHPWFRGHPGGGAGTQNGGSGAGAGLSVDQLGENVGALLGAGLMTKVR